MRPTRLVTYLSAVLIPMAALGCPEVQTDPAAQDQLFGKLIAAADWLKLGKDFVVGSGKFGQLKDVFDLLF